MSFEFLNAIKRELINIDKEDDEDFESISSEDSFYGEKETIPTLITFFSRINSLRSERDDTIIKIFREAYYDNPKECLKILFYLRDKYKGRGERRVFRVIIKFLGEENDYYLRKRLNLIPIYGRWDDLYELFNTPLEEDVITLFKDQLELDKSLESPSNLAKWLKSENTSSLKSRILGKQTRLALGLSSSEYRILLSSLRSKLNLVERSLSKKNYSKLEYGNMPSKARRKYYKSFTKNDGQRYLEFTSLMKSLHKNDSSIKPKYLTKGIVLNEAVYPYDIISGVIRNKDDYSSSIYSNLWARLPNYIKKDTGDSLVVLGINEKNENDMLNRDVVLGGISTALYLREKNKGKFKNHIISMKEPSNFKKVTESTLKERFDAIYENSICDNINVESSLDLVLFAAIKNNLSNEEMPTRIFYIIGKDCNVSLISGYGSSNLDFSLNQLEFQRIKVKWQAANYKIPELIFWMIESQSDYNLILKNENNIKYCFGYNSEIFLNLIRGDSTSTIDLLKEVLTSERYRPLE